jgi:hypothetical protein
MKFATNLDQEREMNREPSEFGESFWKVEKLDFPNPDHSPDSLDSRFLNLDITRSSGPTLPKRPWFVWRLG